MNQDVFVTYGWNRMSYIVMKSLSAKGLTVHLGDTSSINMNSFSFITHKSLQYPNFYQFPNEFLTYVLNYIKCQNIEFLIPMHEDIFIFAKNIDLMKNNGVKTLIPEYAKIEIAHNKSLSQNHAKNLSIPTPFSIQPKNEEDCRNFFNSFPKPIILKYHESNSSKGVFFIHNVNSFKDHLSSIDSFILQEYVNGKGYGVSMLYNSGSLRATFTHVRIAEKILTGGTSTLRQSVKNETLEFYAKKILDSLHWNGVAMVEFKYDEKLRKGWFIEINPRFWGSLALPYYAGVDFPYLYFKILRDGDVESVFTYKEGITAKWLFGSFIGFTENLIKHKKINFYHFTSKADCYDDFSMKDPLIFLGETAYYFFKFLKSFKLNPTKDSIFRLSDLQ